MTDRFVKGLTNLTDSYERVGAISLRCSEMPNRHPETWKGEDWDNDTLLLRFERQTVTGLPETNSFIFTIRTYYSDLLSEEMLPLTIQAFENFNLNSYLGDLKDDKEKWSKICKKIEKKMSKVENLRK